MTQTSDLKERLARDANSLLLGELMRISNEQFDEVMRQLMLELQLEPRKVRNKPAYFFAEVVSIKDLKREIVFVNKEQTTISTIDVDKLATYAEKVKVPRSVLITLGDISKDAEKESVRQGVRLINGTELAELIRNSGLEDMILKDFAEGNIESPPPPGEDSSLEGQLKIGTERLRAGDTAVALEYFERSIAAAPKSDRAWRLKGEALHKLGHHSKAVECYAHALELNPKSAETWEAIAVTMYSLGRHEEELQAYENALNIDPERESALSKMGATRLKLGRYHEALESLDRVIKMNPRLENVHNSRGIALKCLNRLDDALDAFDAALGLNPDMADAWSNKGETLIDLGRLEEALAAYEHLVALRPNHGLAWQIKGEIESRLNRRTDAIHSLEKALEFDPTNTSIKKLLDSEKSKLQSKQADLHGRITSIFGTVKVGTSPPPAEASAQPAPESAGPPVSEIEELEEERVVEEEEPEEILDEGGIIEAEEWEESGVGVAEEVFGDSAEIMLLMRRPDVAIQELEKGLRLEPLSIRMLVLKGIALHQLGEDDRALQALSSAIEIDPENADAIYSIEFINQSQGKFTEAEEAMQTLLDGKHWIPEVLAALDSALANKTKKVAEHMEVAISLEPTAIAWNHKGLLDLDQGEFERAIDAFERARELEEVFSDPSNNMGVANFKLGNLEESARYYDLAVSAHPRNFVAWSNRGVLLLSQKRFKEAITCFDQSLLLENDPLVLINKGFALLEMDQVNDAVKMLDESLRIKKTPEGYNNKGIALVLKDRIGEAVNCFREAVKLSPDFEDAIKNLNEHKDKVKPEEKPPAREISVPPTSPEEVWEMLGRVDMASLNRLKKAELIEICHVLGLKITGTKKNLAERIIGAHENSEK